MGRAIAVWERRCMIMIKWHWEGTNPFMKIHFVVRAHTVYHEYVFIGHATLRNADNMISLCAECLNSPFYRHPLWIAKSIANIANTSISEQRRFTVSKIIPRNDEWNNKAEDVNSHLNDMWRHFIFDLLTTLVLIRETSQQQQTASKWKRFL